MRSDKFVRGIRGPIGSAKTSTCCIELFRRASQQAPDAEGIRPTRFVALRNTGPELKTTTIKSWLDWFPEDVWGRFIWQPPYTHHIKQGDIDMEVIFLALDNEEDIKKLYSLEVTGAWMNEARFMPKIVLDTLTERVGRYPSLRRVPPSWKGIIMDTNSMDPDHWWPMMAGETPIPEDIPPEERLMLQKPDNWEFFVQPPAMFETRDINGNGTGWQINPDAENLANLLPDYYPNQVQGKTRSHILRNVANQLVIMKDGKTVHPSFSETMHLAGTPLPIYPGVPVYMGMDFGLTPAALFGQIVRGQWLIQRELVSVSMGAKAFTEDAKRLLARDYPLCDVYAYGDPAGDDRAQTDETTPFMIVKAGGIDMKPAAPNNDFVIRVEALEDVFRRMVDGRPGILIDPSCRHFRKALSGGYHYPKVGKGEVRYADRPLKNASSHIAEAGQYLFLGAGEGKSVTRRAGEAAKPKVAKTKFNALSRMHSSRTGNRYQQR